MAERRIRAIVRGVVQGVGFRHFTRERAKALRLHGFVRNKADGTVEIEVEGDTNALNDFLAWLQNGPRHAEVTEVEIEELLLRANEVSFEILR